MTQTHDVSFVFIELGAVVVGLAVLARIASRIGFSAIPLYLLAGLAFGNGGLLPLNLSRGFIELGAEIGVLLLLFMLGLEYTGEELKDNLKRGSFAGVIDFVLNFPPGLIAGLLLGWKPLAAILLGGVTYISSSGVIAKVLAELRRLDWPGDAGRARGLGVGGSCDGCLSAACRSSSGEQRRDKDGYL